MTAGSVGNWPTCLQPDRGGNEGGISENNPDDAIKETECYNGGDRQEPAKIDGSDGENDGKVAPCPVGGVLIGVGPMRFVKLLAPHHAENERHGGVNDEHTEQNNPAPEQSRLDPRGLK